MAHPEADPTATQLYDELSKMELIDVWCNGCQATRKMNALFAKYNKTGEISSCAKCRGLKLNQ